MHLLTSIFLYLQLSIFFNQVSSQNFSNSFWGHTIITYRYAKKTVSRLGVSKILITNFHTKSKTQINEGFEKKNDMLILPCKVESNYSLNMEYTF
jgi:hypothetical protein